MANSPRVREAIVVGAGPNGLTAAARLASEGWRVRVLEAAPTVGGGSRSRRLGETPDAPGAIIDVCAAVHPFGAGSPAFEELQLGEHGLEWVHAPVALAHPFADGSAAVLYRDLERTALGLGRDGDRWRSLIGPFAHDWTRFRHLALGPVPSSLVHHPARMARFGLEAVLPATVFARLLLHTSPGRALIGGLAAHTGERLALPTSAGVAVALAAAAHAVGMPVARGGSQRIVDALRAVIEQHGGVIECNRSVATLADLSPADVVLLDLTPHQVATMTGAPTPRWRRGVAAWKMDLVLSAPMPWRNPECASAATVHLGGTIEEISAAERATVRGDVVDEPFVIVSQPTAADRSRAAAGQHVVWAYRHVPNGCDDARATGGIERRFDQFAPGWRDVVVSRSVTTALDYAAYNANYLGGDIAGGAMTPWQMIARPRLAIDPYRTKTPGVWICSQSTPPGPGVHGMCGWHAAGSVLEHTTGRHGRET
jgi:phytoene dehydrogenase-like protein